MPFYSVKIYKAFPKLTKSSVIPYIILLSSQVLNVNLRKKKISFYNKLCINCLSSLMHIRTAEKNSILKNTDLQNSFNNQQKSG